MRPHEESLWKDATPELMSEEEDDVRDGSPMWIVSPPVGRSSSLSTLCQELQQRRCPGSRSRRRVLQDIGNLNGDSMLDHHNESFTLLQL